MVNSLPYTQSELSANAFLVWENEIDLDPVCRDFAGRVGDATAIRTRHDSRGIIWFLGETRLWFEFAVEEFIEVFVSVLQVGNKQFTKGDIVSLDEMGLKPSTR